MKSEADLVFPARKSQILTEITALKNLQDEQLALANTAHALTLYYLSGGSENPGFDVQDKVRPEDHDLRGWFSKTYGENYLDILYNQLSLNPDTAAIAITAAFSSNDHGYGMRQMALNNYHLGNILTNAKRTRERRAEASSYARQLCILAGRALFSGDPPTGDLFAILNNSIEIWYQLNYPNVTLPSVNKMLNGKLFLKPFTLTVSSYPFFLVCALYDMHKQGTDADSWLKNTLSNSMPAKDIAKLFEDLDGVKPEEFIPLQAALDSAQTVYDNAQAIITSRTKAHGSNYTNPPTWDGNARQYDYVQERLKREHDVLLAVGDQIPRGYELSSVTIDGVSLSNVNTDQFWILHNTYQSDKQNLAMAEAQLKKAQADYDALESSDLAYVDYHTQSIWAALEATKLPNGAYNSDLMLDIIDAVVAKILGITNSREDGNPSNGNIGIAPIRGGRPANASNVVDMTKIISFYAIALRGVTPKAYWVTNLSHRIVPIPLNGGAAHDIYLYVADLKTGGINKDERLLVARIEADRDTAISIIASYLPDVPIYTPGTNEALPRSIQDSYGAKVMENKSVKQWFNNTQKSMFNYVYVAQSAWQHGLDVRTQPGQKALDNAKIEAEGLAIANYPNDPPFHNVEADFLIIDSLVNKKYFGVNTFSPNISHLHYSPVYSQAKTLANVTKDADRRVFNAKNTLHASELKVIAFPQSVTDKIIQWTKTVPAQIVKLLNEVNAIQNSGWYEFKHTASRNAIYAPTAQNQTLTLEQLWPEYVTESGFRITDLLNNLEPFYKFLANRTESLFIKNPAAVVENAYLRLLFRKPSETAPELDYILAYSQGGKGVTFNTEFYDYLAILGALTYFNSYHLYTDGTRGNIAGTRNRTYPYWCSGPNVRSKVEAIVESVVGLATPIEIYTTPMNDLEDISNIHQVLSNLKVLDGMAEMPVFDVPEFNVKWSGQTGSVINPFTNNPDGFPDIPKQGLTASMTPRLQNNYGDVFYKTLFDTCVMQPHFEFDVEYSRSFLRIPVRTTGVSGKVYGNRPSSGTMESAAVDTRVSKFVQGGGIASDVNIALGVGTLAALASIYGLFRAASGYRLE